MRKSNPEFKPQGSLIQRLIRENLDIDLLFFVIRRDLIYVILLFVFGVFGLWVFLRYSIPNYRATTILTYEVEETEKSYQDIIQNPVSKLEKKYDISYLYSTSFYEELVDSLKLNYDLSEKGRIKNFPIFPINFPFGLIVEAIDPEYVDIPVSIRTSTNTAELSYKFKDSILSKTITNGEQVTTQFFQAEVFWDKSVENREFIVDFYSEEELFNLISENLSAQVFEGQIYLDYVGSPTALNNYILNKIPPIFIQQDILRQQSKSRNVISYIKNQTEALNSKIELQRSEINSLSKPLEFLSFTFSIKDSSNIIKQTYEEIERIDYSLEMNQLLDSVVQTNNDFFNYKLRDLGIYQSKYIEYFNKIEQLFLIKKELQIGIKEKHLRIQLLNEDIDKAKREFSDLVQLFEQQLMEQKESLTYRIVQLNEELQYINENLDEYNERIRILNYNQGIYQQLVQKELEFQINKAGVVSDLEVVQEANRNEQIFPDQQQYLIIVLGVCGFLGILFLFIRYILHDKLISPKEVEHNVNAPLLGIIPRIGSQHIDSSIPIVISHPNSIIGEAYRNLRVNLDFILPNRDKATILIGSTISGEGKTFSAINIAAMYHNLGKKVLLIDGDFRKPSVDSELDLDSEFGVTDYLIGNISIEEAKVNYQEGFDVLPVGRIPPNAPELFRSEKMLELIQQSKSTYDYIILDAPPVGLVTDSIAIYDIVDALIYVSREGYSRKSFFSLPNEIIASGKMNNLVTVYNYAKVRRKRSKGYSSGYGYTYGYSYSYGYTYGYGYGYGMNKPTPEETLLPVNPLYRFFFPSKRKKKKSNQSSF